MELDYFFLRKNIKETVFFHLLDLFEPANARSNGLEVCQHAAQPSLVHIEHAATFRFFTNGVLSLLLGAYKEHSFAICHGVTDKVVSFVDLSYGLLEINDINTISLSENVLCH